MCERESFIPKKTTLMNQSLFAPLLVAMLVTPVKARASGNGWTKALLESKQEHEREWQQSATMIANSSNMLLAIVHGFKAFLSKPAPPSPPRQSSHYSHKQPSHSPIRQRS